MKPSFDYLTNDAATPSANKGFSENRSVDALVDRAASVFGGQILGALRTAPPEGLHAFDLVDATKMDVQTLHQVLDVIKQPPYAWVDVDKTDPKGNYIIRLTDQGKKYLDQLQSGLAR